MLDAFNEGSPYTAKKVRDCRETKEVLRDGNKRKANALLKVKGRRTERKRLNIVKSKSNIKNKEAVASLFYCYSAFNYVVKSNVF